MMLEDNRAATIPDWRGRLASVELLPIWGLLALVFWIMPLAAPAESSTTGIRIKKVLPHFIDKQGYHTLSPSLLERDAYQAVLRKDPSKRGGLRFDIQCGSIPPNAGLTLRLEVRGSKDLKSTFVQQERVLGNKDRFHRWQVMTLSGDEYQKVGDMVAWRVTLQRGITVLAEQKSFLW